MIYSYTQISQYLTCPRRYRHRYLDGWQEKDSRAAMLFGRSFERALAAYFLRQDAAETLFREWQPCRNQEPRYSGNDTWDRMLDQGIQLLDRSAKTTAFAFASRGAICRSSLPASCQPRMSSSPSSMPLVNWMADGRCGRPPRAAIRRSPMD